MFLTASDRLARATTNVCLFGKSGAGKTTQALTLPQEETLFVDLEAGTLAIQDGTMDVVDVRSSAQELGIHPWQFARAVALMIGGPDPAVPDDDPYGAGTYDAIAEELTKRGMGPDQLKHPIIFVDSLTVAARHSLAWAQRQPEGWSEKKNAPDMLGAYGLHGREMVRWFTHLQHAPRNVVMVAILDEVTDELGRKTYSPQIEGSKAGRELPGIFDEVITLTMLPDANKKLHRALVCHTDNPWGLPAKDRSGCLNMVEPPNLWAAMQKIKKAKRVTSKIQVDLPEELQNL